LKAPRSPPRRARGRFISVTGPEFRSWLERERATGRRALNAIAPQRRQLLAETHGLERFALRMALVDLTGSVATWGNAVHERLEEAGHVEAAALFATGPPFAATDPSSDDCDRLSEYVEARLQVLGDLLAGHAP
jgi:hypothetical protein